jgi:DNA-binding NarL/FixJ family response regulator
MRALLAAKNPLFRAGLRYVVERNLDDATVDEAATLGEVVTAGSRSERPDLLVIELGLPGLEGFDGLRRLRQQLGAVPIVVIGPAVGRRAILQAIESGAHGFVPETTSVEVAAEALKLVLSGNVYVPATVLATGEPEPAERPVANDGRPAQSADLASLTPRQREVLDLLVRGHSNREIAAHLGVAQGTVRIHVAAILRALNVRNRTQAALTAMNKRAG